MELVKKSVQSVLEKDRIGSPVFLRCVLHVTGEGTDLLPSVAEVAGLANAWIPSPPSARLCPRRRKRNTDYLNGSLCCRADGTVECQSGPY